MSRRRQLGNGPIDARRWRAVWVFALLVSSLVALPATSASATTPVFINEIHYDNSGADAGEAIEVAGPAGTDLSGWSLVLYNGNGGTAYATMPLTGVIADQDNGFGTAFVSHPGIQNGAPDGVALVGTGGSVVQFLSYEGAFTAVGGPADGLTSTDIGVAEGSSTPVGDSLQLTGTGAVYEDFSWATSQPDTFGAINTGQSFGGTVDAPVLVACGSWLNAVETITAVRGISASDDDGTVVSMSIDVSPTPAEGSITLQNFVAAGAPGGTATGDVVVDGGVPDGIYTVTVTAANDDLEPQEGTCSFNVDVDPFLTIGEVQGVVADTDSGTEHSSPYEGQYVAVQGVIYEKTQEYRSSGGAFYGFFLQNTEATSDGDPLSSDGLFVFHLQYETLLVDGGGFYEPQIGDEVVLRGQVQERFGNTRLNNPRLVSLVRTGVVLDDEVPAFDVDPPSSIGPTGYDDIQDAYRYWERHEGMRGVVPAGSIVLDGRDVFTSSFDSEVWVARPDSLIAQRAETYARRAYRDPHPLDDIGAELFDNGNPYRILLGSFGVKEWADDTTMFLAPARTYDTVIDALTGGVYYNFGKYSIQVDEQIQLDHGVDPSLNGAPTPLDPELEYGIAVFNVENLYDYVDDPFDGCDFHGDTGCPGVNPPFDYVPASDAVYQERLGEIATQIIDDLGAPNIVMVQEAEDQDICTVNAGVYACGDENDADGKPDVLQELAVRIAQLGGPAYDAALDRDGADDRGIVSGYLYRTDRVELLGATADHPVLGDTPTVDYPYSAPLPFNADVQNPKALNAELPGFVTGDTDGDNVFTRAPQVAWFRIWRDTVGLSAFQDVYLVDNHFSSGPDRRVGQRSEQANYNAAIVDALQTAYPGVYVGVGGDLNVYPRPDDPFTPPDTSDQLAGLYNQGMVNLWNVLVTVDPVSAFGYVYEGQSQTLDQSFVVPEWLAELSNVWSVHINADFPADHPGDGARGTSDHDPLLSAFTLVPTVDRIEMLLRYYESMGMVTGNQTTKVLLGHLEKARAFDAEGQHDAYLAQLEAFARQVQGKAPRFVSQDAADALASEALLLRSLG